MPFSGGIAPLCRLTRVLPMHRALLCSLVLCGLSFKDIARAQSTSADVRRSKPPLDRPLTRSQFAQLRPRDEFQECSTCPRMVVVPSGSFMMGSNNSSQDERPVHKVTIRRAFAAGKFEVTVAEYEACTTDRACNQPQWRRRGSYYNIKTGSDNYYKKLGTALTDPRHPIVGISWHDAKQFTAWVNTKVVGTPYRLLTEAEWEYLARAGTGEQIYWWGNRFNPNYANAAGTSKRDQWEFTSPVGMFPGNPFGLHDLHGNVWEWVDECHTDSYAGAPNDGSAHPTEVCGRRILRGGSWYFVPRLLRSADRFRLPAVSRLSDIGFRIARMLTPSTPR